jgi:hypothetical protein
VLNCATSASLSFQPPQQGDPFDHFSVDLIVHCEFLLVIVFDSEYTIRDGNEQGQTG